MSAPEKAMEEAAPESAEKAGVSAETAGLQPLRKALAGGVPRAQRLAEQLVETLVVEPLYATEEQAKFVLDFDPGQVLVDRDSDHLTLKEGARAHLSRGERHELVKLTLAVVWRDARRTFEAISALSEEEIADDPLRAPLVKGRIAEVFAEIPAYRIPDLPEIATMLESIALLGIRFPAAPLQFRELIFALRALLEESLPRFEMYPVVLRTASRLLIVESAYRLTPNAFDPRARFRSHLTNQDLRQLFLNIPLASGRMSMQVAEDVARDGVGALRRLAKTAPWPDGLRKGLQKLPAIDFLSGATDASEDEAQT